MPSLIRYTSGFSRMRCSNTRVQAGDACLGVAGCGESISSCEISENVDCVNISRTYVYLESTYGTQFDAGKVLSCHVQQLSLQSHMWIRVGHMLIGITSMLTRSASMLISNARILVSSLSMLIRRASVLVGSAIMLTREMIFQLGRLFACALDRVLIAAHFVHVTVLRA